LKGVVVEMKENFRYRVGRVVDVNEPFLPGISVIGMVQVHIDGVVHALLPGGLLGIGIESQGDG
jgi:hypothetical protein